MSTDPSEPNPTAVPSPEGSNSLASPATTSQVQIGTTGTAAPDLVTTDAPSDFTAWVNTALQSRLGLAKYSLIPMLTKKDLINKIWQDPTIQSDYVTNHQQLSGGNISSLAIIENQIQSVLQGQGNDPSVAIDYTNMLQVAGVPLTQTEQAGLASATQAVNAPVPKPFGSNVVSGYDFGTPMPKGGWTGTGQSFGWNTHLGVDYGTRAGDRIVSPFAGTATVETGVPGYGNYVTITLDNGWKMGFGHVANGTVQNGTRVNPGDLIAIAGQNVGSAKGSVTIVTWQDPQGKYVNPHEALDPIFQGTTFSALGAPGAAGTGYPTVNTKLDSEYPSIKQDWQTYFGSPPSPEDVFNVVAHGTSPVEWQDYIRSMPSHIDGLNQGQAYDTRQTADAVSMKLLGHPSTDGIVKELHAAGTTSQQDITDWYGWNSPAEIEKKVYQKIYQGAKPVMKGIFNEDGGVDPRDIKAIHQSQHGVSHVQ